MIVPKNPRNRSHFVFAAGFCLLELETAERGSVKTLRMTR